VATSDDATRTGAAIRIVLAKLSTELRRNLEREIGRQPDMHVMVFEDDRSTKPVDLLLAVTQAADVLVLGTPDAKAPPPSICDHLLSERPDIMIVLLSHNGDAATMHWLGPRRHQLRRVTADGVLRATRRALSARTLQRHGAARSTGGSC
jgi:hypothetical protein